MGKTSAQLALNEVKSDLTSRLHEVTTRFQGWSVKGPTQETTQSYGYDLCYKGRADLEGIRVSVSVSGQAGRDVTKEDIHILVTSSLCPQDQERFERSTKAATRVIELLDGNAARELEGRIDEIVS